MRILVVNGSLVLPYGIRKGSVLIEDGKIAEVSTGSEIKADGAEVIDAEGRYVSPGFIDMHTHGAGGYDFMDGSAEDILGAADMLMRHGTTTCLPTTLTCADDDLFSFIDNFKKIRDLSRITCRMPGLHLEGPYFDMVQKGAQDPR